MIPAARVAPTTTLEQDWLAAIHREDSLRPEHRSAAGPEITLAATTAAPKLNFPPKTPSGKQYREVQLDYTPEIDVPHKQFDRCHARNRKISLKQPIKYFSFRSKIRLGHPVQKQLLCVPTRRLPLQSADVSRGVDGVAPVLGGDQAAVGNQEEQGGLSETLFSRIPELGELPGPGACSKDLHWRSVSTSLIVLTSTCTKQ